VLAQAGGVGEGVQKQGKLRSQVLRLRWRLRPMPPKLLRRSVPLPWLRGKVLAQF